MKLGSLLATLSPAHRNEALWLLSSLLKMNRGELLLGSDREFSSSELKAWKIAWRRRRAGEPMQYIVGEAPFYGRDFLVSPDVLIPRPETERLVEIVLAHLKGVSSAKVLDIGTGSGAIAVTLKAERPELEVVGSDISAGALKVARANADRLGAAVTFERANLFSESLVQRKFDFVVSNPPYLDFRKDKITKEVRRWEPRLALEPEAQQRTRNPSERAAWCALHIFASCQQCPPRLLAMELSPRIAWYLERKWRKVPGVARVWREADLAGRKRFLLVAWQNG